MRSALLPARPRSLAMLVITALVAGLLSVFALAQPTAAAEDDLISLDATVTSSVLSGAQATVTLTATNRSAAGSGTSLYNIGYSYVLPAGVGYSGPAKSDGNAISDPTSTPLSDGSTLLVFQNVSDLVAGDVKTITFPVMANTTAYPVGSSFGGAARVAGNTDPRTIPTFVTTTDPAVAGTPVSTTSTNTAASTAKATDVSAIKITKDEQSPEHELVRGVHDQATVYTLTVTNTEVAPTDDVVVTDYLPAGLEFLQCGGIDNTTTGPEYDGAPTLDTTKASAPADCREPVSVTTVDDVEGQGSKVFTKVVWNLGRVTGAAPVTIRYLAAVPLRENTMTFRTGTDPAPAPTTAALGSAANLDNNTGASTRQNGSSDVSNGQGQTNLVSATGTYTGTVAPGASTTQSDSTKLTVDAMDLAVAKSVDTDPAAQGDQNQFATGKHATYSLLVRTSEYERSDDITLTDTLPNGLCPVFPVSTAKEGTFPAECDPNSSSAMDGRVTAKASDGTSVPVTVQKVVYDQATGTFAMTFTLPPMATDGAVTVRYDALMRTTYSSTGQAGPTAAGDAFTNTVRMHGTSTGVHGDTGTQEVSDDSAATIVSSTPSIEKQVLPRSAASSVRDVADCTAAGAGAYTTSSSEPFSLGDQVCFRLAVTFPAGVETRNATVTDMLPVGTTSGNEWTEGQDWAVGAESDVTDVALSGTHDDRSATFAVGRTVTGASGTYVDSTSAQPTRLVLYVVAHIDDAGSDSTKPDITANLMKYAQQNTDDKVTSLRASADYAVAGSPVVSLDKHITQAGGNTVSDPVYTTEGQSLQYTLTVTNVSGTGAELPVSGLTVWDALPAGIACGAVPTSDTYRCLEDAPAGAATRYADRDFLVWTGLGPIAPEASIDLTYTMTIPSPGYAGTGYTNAASVVSFTTASNDGTPQTWIPEPSGTSAHSSGATGDQGSAASADAQRTVTIQPNTVVKAGGAVDPLSQSNPSAVPGQGLRYTYSGTVPAHTSVGAAVLADSLPSGIDTTQSTTWELTMPGAGTPVTRSMTDGDATVQYGTDPNGDPYSFTFTGGGTKTAGTLRFPETFDNTGDRDLTFSIKVEGLRVSSGVSDTNTSSATYDDTRLRNTATFTSIDPITKATSAPPSSVDVVARAPRMTLTKSHTPTGPVTGADTITWTITAKNTASVASARSVIIADCFPSSLVFGPSIPEETPSAEITTAQRDALGCATGTTLHAWKLDDSVAPGGTATITVTGALGNSASATSSFGNTAVVLASSLDTDYGTTGRSYVQRMTAVDNVSVASPTVTKTLTAPNWNAAAGTVNQATTDPAGSTPLSVRAGDAGTYTVTVTVPRNVALHDGVVTDTLPAGVVRNGEPSASVAPGTFTATPTFDTAGRVLTVRVSDIGTDQSQPVRVTIAVPVTIGSGATRGTATKNSAVLTFNKTPGDASTSGSVTSNQAFANVATPSLTVNKTATTGGVTSNTVSAEPGAAVHYTVTVTNAPGASPAYSTIVTDCLPDGIVLDTTKPISDGGVYTAGGGCGGGTITWTGLTVSGASTATPLELHYSATLAPDADLDGTARVNRATVQSYRSLPDTQDGPAGDSYGPVSATARVTPAFPDVEVTKTNTTAGGLSYIGKPSDFAVTLRNTGSAVRQASVQDELPTGWSFDDGSAQVVRGAVSTPAPAPTVDGRSLTWSSLGALGNGEALTLLYTATPTDALATAADTGTSVLHTNHVRVQVESGSRGTSYDHGNGSFVHYPDAADGSAGTDATADAVIARADLALTKTATTNRVVAGAITPKAWTITVANTSGDAARGTTVVDTTSGLPDGASLAFSGTGWTCTATDGTWTCANGATVAAGDSFPDLDVALTLPADAPLTAIRNSATIEQQLGQTFDDDPTNDSDDASVTPVAVADLAITKTGPTDAVAAGGTVSWQLSVQNLLDADEQSLSDARGTVTVTDTLPDTVTLQSATSTDPAWTCDTDGNTVTCERQGLASGATAAAITVTAAVHSDVTASQPIQNTARVAVSSTTTDPRGSNDEDEATSRVDDRTSLTVAKAFGTKAQIAPDATDRATLVAGATADWTITVENTGTADARTVRVTDALESGTSLQGGTQTDGDWTCTTPSDDGTDVTCALDGTLVAGAETAFTIRVTTPSSMTGDLANTAIVTAANATAQRAGTTSRATQTAGLSVTKTADVATLDAGGDVTYTITVANPDGPSDLPAGDADGPSIRVQDTLPAGVEFRGLSDETLQHWALESNEDGVVTLTSTAGIAVGATDPNAIVMTVHVPASFRGASVTNAVTAAPVTASGPTAHDDAVVDVTTHADLSVTKVRTSAPVADAGTDVTYDVTVSNAGPSDAQDVTWTDTPPAGMTVTSVTTDDDSWEQGATPATWSTPTLPTGATTVFHVTASIASGTPAGTLRNTASVGSATPDTDPSDDTAGDDVTVTTHASLALTKTPVTKVGSTTVSKRVTAGDQQVWLLQVRNSGPSDEQPTTVVTDQLPAGLTFVSATSDGAAWRCDGTTDPTLVTCSLPATIVAGTDAPGLWITTKVASGYTADEIANRAVVTAQGTPAPNGTTDEPVTSPLPVQDVANVAITIGHDGTAVIGKDLPETIRVRNDGLSDAIGVTATYTLPKGLTYDSTEADPAWTTTSVVRNADGSTTVTFTLAGVLTAGAHAPVITVHQTPTVDAYPGVQPTATVSTATTETTLADNDASDELGVAAASSLAVTKTHTGQLVRGGTVGYTITVRNDGLTEDPGPVVVTDRLPDGLSLVSVDDGGAATCTDGRTVACTLAGPLATGGEVTLQVTVRIADDAADRITNVATVASPTAQVVPVSGEIRPSDPMRAADPAPVQDAPQRGGGELAFTGAAGLGLGALVAALLTALGGILLATRRRRRA